MTKCVIVQIRYRQCTACSFYKRLRLCLPYAQLLALNEEAGRMLGGWLKHSEAV